MYEDLLCILDTLNVTESWLTAIEIIQLRRSKEEILILIFFSTNLRCFCMLPAVKVTGNYSVIMTLYLHNFSSN